MSEMSVLEKMNQAKPNDVIRDTGETQSVAGLHLRCYTNGRKCFYFTYISRKGRRRNPKIGENIGLTEARRRAQYLKSQVVLGQDPVGDWEEAKNEKTVGETYEHILKHHWSQERFKKSGRNKAVQLIYHKYLEEKFGHVKLSDVTPRDVRTWHGSMSQIPTSANRALEVLSRIYTHAYDQEWITDNPCARVTPFKEKKRTRVATKEELKNIIVTLHERVKDPEAKDAAAALFLLALIFTGARPKDIEYARWDTFVKDPQAGHGVLTFYGKSTAETGEMERVVFPKILVDLMERFPRREDGRMFGRENVRALWAKLTSEFNCQDLWSRDLRRTFASIGLSKGVSLDSIAETLNHKSSQTTKTYARAFGTSREDTANEVAAAVAEIAELL